ncbi:hypothetical protein LXL04_034400 [Taraxacum kok-saghyz]
MSYSMIFRLRSPQFSQTLSEAEYQKDANKPVSAGPSTDQGKGVADEEEIRCHNCQGLNHFSHDCKSKRKEEETGSKAYYLAKLKE